MQGKSRLESGLGLCGRTQTGVMGLCKFLHSLQLKETP